LAMVEQSLLERFRSPLGSMADFFRGNPRQSAVRTTSSVTFAYRPATRPISRHLLAEEERLEIAGEEEESRLAALESGVNRDGDIAMFLRGRIEGVEVDGPVNADGGTVVMGGIVRHSSTRGGRGSNAPMPQHERSLQTDQLQVFYSMDQSAVAFDTQGYVFPDSQRWEQLTQQRRELLATNGGQAAPNAYFYNGGNLYVSENTNGSGQISLGTTVYPVADLLVPLGQDSQNGGWQASTNYVVLDDNGRMQNLLVLSGDQLDVAQVEKTIAELTEAGGIVLPGLGPQETGYWNPSVTTGEDGKATVSFTVPERSTAWKLIAQGITTETLAGEADSELVVKKDLFGQLRLPQAFADGDEARVMVSVHNDAVEKGPIEVTLTTTIAGRTVEEKQTLNVESKGIHELVFTTKLDRPEKPKDDKAAAAVPEINAEFALTVSAGEKTDVVRRSVPLKPYGMPVFATASGSGTSDTTAWVEAKKEMPTTDPSLQILVGPTVERSLLDIVMGTAPGCQLASIRIASGLETSTSDLMASLGLQALLAGTRQADGPQAQALDSRVRSAVGSLVSSQNDDGGWSWTGRGGSSNRYGTSRILWALSLARKAGYNVPDEAYDKAVAFLRDQVVKITASDYESKAILLHGLSTAGEGDFALANRLYRDRPTLSTAALAHLALAFAEMDRKSTAAELLELLAERNLDDVPSRRKVAAGSLPWSHSSAELRALFALAVQKVTPKAPRAKESVDWLLAHRTGHRWSPDKATGPAALALCRWFAENRFEDEHYKLVVFVNDVEAATLEMDGASGTQTIGVPAKLLADGKQRINFQITGRGRFTYQCILGGFVDADKLKSTTPDWTVKRTYEPAPLEMDGREIPRGFNVLTGHYDPFHNPLTELPTGRRGLVELEIRRHNIPHNTPVEQLEYLVVTEPIPAGATVIEQSVKGPFERFEIAPGAITFYVGSRLSIGTIRYQLHGYQPGKYRTVPTVIRDAYRPDRLAVSTPKSLTVLPTGSKSVDKYRLSPQELFELGKRHFEKKAMKETETHLTELFEKWNLNPDTYKKTVEMLLDAHLEIGPPARVVRYFEIIKERWPESEIPFAKILKVGAAYHEMGEYERSYLVFRATVESSFSRESGVAGFLEGQGEFVRSVEVMGRLSREYPPEGYVASATYGLAQSVYAKAPLAADDEKLRKQKINRVDLIRRAWTMLESFLTAYPEDPAADQAAFSAANALLELKAYDEATEACTRYAKRYPDSDLLDSYWYMVGYCHFATGKHEEALAMCRKVAEAKRTDKKTGRTVESPNKWRAVYILGQVYHSLGDAADAIEEYTRVEDRFADAKEAIAYFTRKAIDLPEVTTFKPDTPVEVELKFRNVAACDVKVYRIDLMKFSLLKRNLGGITRINLSGIRPYHEAEIELGDGKDYRDRTHKLDLPLKEQGAYLVVSRGDNLHASGLVLVTPLAVEVQEDTASGRVRTTVKNLIEDRYIKDIHVKVIGTRNSEFTSGETDLRGVFVADGIQGQSTVIAQASSSHYAFFRGQTELVPQAPEPTATTPGAQPSAPQGKASLDFQLLEGLNRTNSTLQAPKVQLLNRMYDSKGSGVKADAAF
ncbi:MAG: tetratricopeptide repeat protein, partial [Planctomycetes bacterium]|nr:tetratricopeptide repeat protein [Planctomycetota bacterium]